MTANKSDFHRVEKESFMNFMKLMVILFLAMILMPLTSHAAEPSKKYVLTVAWGLAVNTVFVAFQEFDTNETCEAVAKKLNKRLSFNVVPGSMASCDPK